MNINEQEKTINFVYKHDIDCDVPSRLLDLSSELGELAKLVLKETEYGKHEFHSTNEIDDKMGQTYLVFLELANEIGVNLEDVLKRAMEANEIKLTEKEQKKSNNFGREEKIELKENKKESKKHFFGFKKKQDKK